MSLVPTLSVDCRNCKGKGCVECSYTGEMAQCGHCDQLRPTSVEECTRCEDVAFANLETLALKRRCVGVQR